MFGIINSNSGKYLGTIYTFARTFKSGSRGFYGSGDITDIETGKRYIVNLQLVELGTKPLQVDTGEQKPQPKEKK